MDIEQALDFAMIKAGVSALKEKQKECIVKFVEGHDVFASLPTGYGKSLIYGLLPDTFNKIKGMYNLSQCYIMLRE